MLSNTKLGRYTYAMGSNRQAAALSGVDVKKWQMLMHVIAGRHGRYPWHFLRGDVHHDDAVQGKGLELTAIAAAVIDANPGGWNRNDLRNHDRRVHDVGAGPGLMRWALRPSARRL